MYRFEVTYDTVSEKERSALSRFFFHELMGEIALEWSELIRSSIKKNHEVIIYKIYCEEKFLGIAILSIVRRLQITQWTTVATLFKKFVHFDVGFIEIPLSNLSGILTLEGVDSRERRNIIDAFGRHIRQTVDLDILCIKIDSTSDQLHDFSFCRNIVTLPFHPNTLLNYSYKSFDEYVNSLPRKKYRRCMSDMRNLKNINGQVDIVHDLSSINDEIYRLYNKTASRSKKKKNYIEMPVQINEDFFRNLPQFSRMKPCAIIVSIH